MAKKICDFCGKEIEGEMSFSGESRIFSKGDSKESKPVRICPDCIKTCMNLIDEHNRKKVTHKHIDLTPDTIKAGLDEWVIGQEYAKKTIATEVYNHLKRIKRLEGDPQANKKLRIDKSNIIMVGPTGTGKTEIVRALGDILDIPYTIQNATSFTASGYVGRDVEDILRDLMDAADNDLTKAERGIVFIDEFDKLKKEYTANGNKDVGGEAVQQALLKMIEGGEYDVKRDKTDRASSFKFDTTNVLFVLGGAFEGISEIVSKRLKQESSIGFGAHKESKKKVEYNEIADKITQADLKEFGIISEVLGRCPVIAPLNELSVEQLIHILTQPKHAIVKQFTELLKLDNKDLVVDFTKEGLEAIAKEAKENKIGARALRSMLTKILGDAMYDIPKDKTIIKLTIGKDMKCIYGREAIKAGPVGAAAEAEK